MERIPVSAAEVIAIGYDGATQTLEVEFDTGHIYRYLNVPESAYQELLAADLPRRYFHQHIYYAYPYQRVT